MGVMGVTDVMGVTATKGVMGVTAVIWVTAVICVTAVMGVTAAGAVVCPNPGHTAGVTTWIHSARTGRPAPVSNMYGARWMCTFISLPASPA
ncbi:MAG: hypothetical protein KDD83_08460 [Caldilineaceae bacterium]|nr:hypothetical protein [Caldilineaceae bacterium]